MIVTPDAAPFAQTKNACLHAGTWEALRKSEDHRRPGGHAFDVYSPIDPASVYGPWLVAWRIGTQQVLPPAFGMARNLLTSAPRVKARPEFSPISPNLHAPRPKRKGQR